MKLSAIKTKGNLRKYTMILALLLIWSIFTLLTRGLFIKPRNLTNVARQMAITSILAIGMVLVIVSGNIDLSVGSTTGLAGGVAAMLHVWNGWPVLPAIIAGLLLGLIIGFWNGYWIAYRQVPSFIVTLGGMLIFRGILIGFSKGITIAPLQESFRAIGQSFIPKYLGIILGIAAIVFYVIGVLKTRASKRKYRLPVLEPYKEIMKAIFICMLIIGFVLLLNTYQGIPLPALLVLGLAIIFTIASKKTKFGRHIYAIGGNPEAAKFSGINIQKRVLYTFALMGLMGGIAGIVLTSRLGAATISAGTFFELDAIAACVIGGTSLRGGIGSIPGAIIGALVMASLDNGMSLMNTEAFWQQIVKGLILLLAVWIDTSTKKQ